MAPTTQSAAYRRSKRALDFAGAVLCLVVLAPVMLAAAVYVYLDLGLPLFFRQQRSGISGAEFTLWKFRTMLGGEGLPDAARLTPAGALLRRWSIDELPQLWNVLRGEMSLVGPRPLLPEYVSGYTDFQRRRLDVLPGITGLAQVSGRNTLGWDEKFRCDVWYVDHASIALDLLILYKTAGQVLRRTGINEPGQATAARFTASVVEGGRSL